ncbi:hypothetical protein PGB90_006102 [Kerria lacca]
MMLHVGIVLLILGMFLIGSGISPDTFPHKVESIICGTNSYSVVLHHAHKFNHRQSHYVSEKEEYESTVALFSPC